MNAMTAAHKTLPFGTWLEVENFHNGQTTTVRVNDRGPFVAGRILDVSRSAAVALGMMGSGVIQGRLRVVSSPSAAPAPAFVVQVGAFAVEASARDLHRRLTEAGFEVDVISASPGEAVVYRVRSGRFALRTDADAHAARLARAGYAGVVLAERPEPEPNRGSLNGAR